MKNAKRNIPRIWRDERGSTLILVVLLTLVLSASAIVTLQSVVRTTRAVSVFRSRAQAQLTSDASARTFGDFAGNKGPGWISGSTTALEGETGTDRGVFGATGGNTPTQERRVDVVTTGAVIEQSFEQLQGELLNGSANESGLFQINSGEKTFETRRNVKWRVRVSDMIDGIPAPMFGDGYCFKKATISAEAQVGKIDTNWNRANNVAVSRHMLDGLIGPYKCQ